MKRPGFLQIRSGDLFTDNIMETEDGKYIIRVENQSSSKATLNLGSNIAYENPNIHKSLLDEHGVNWNDVGTRSYESKDYTVYSYSYGGKTAEVWVYGNIEVL